MKKYIFVLICLLFSFHEAHATPPTPLAYTSTANPLVAIPVTPTSPLPIAVYDSGNHSGYCYTSNGSGSPATFQVCSGGGGGSSIAINSTTSNLTYYPMLATTTGAAVGTVYIDTTSPFPYNPSTGTLSALALVTSSLIDNGNASLVGTTTISTAQILAGNAVFTNLTGTTISGTNASISGTTTLGVLQVTGNAALVGTTTISTVQIGAGNAIFTTVTGTNGEFTNILATTITSTTENATTINFTNALGTTITATNIEGIGNAKLAGTTTVNNISITGTCVGCTATPAAGSIYNIQYNNGSGAFAAATGLNVSTTRGGIDFLAAVTTANLISLPASGADVTSIAIGESSLLAQTSTGNDNTAVGGFALTAVTTGVKNTAYGWDAGQTITVGSNNTIMGALVASTTLTTGTSNILIGTNQTTDTPLTTTTSAISIGVGARAGSTDVAIGTSALGATTTNVNNNVAIGNLALSAVTIGVNNVAIGGTALQLLTTGTRNVALGSGGPLGVATVGSYNFGLGKTACGGVTTGGQNVCIGANAGDSLPTTGSYNILIGSEVNGGTTTHTVLSSTTTSIGIGYGVIVGNGDVVVGHLASASQTTNGAHSSMLGFKAFNATTGSGNTGMGYQVGLLESSGINNTLIGNSVASTVLTTGSGNILIGTDNTTTVPLAATTSAVSIGTGVKAGTGDTGVGFGALLATITNANDNTAIGFKALTAATTGINNTAVGYQAGKALTVDGFNNAFGVNALATQAATATTSATGNTALGYAALTALTTGVSNVALGNNAGVAVTVGGQNTLAGNNAGALLTTGTGNTILGYNAESAVLTIGSDNILIGQGVAATTSSNTNTINIGGIYLATGIGTAATAIPTIHGSLTVPDVTTGTNADFACFATGNVFTLQTSACTISQRKLKEHFVELSGVAALHDLMALKPMQFNFIPTKPKNADPNATTTQYGFIAEDVAAVDPKLAIYENDLKTPKSYRQEALISLLVKGFQEQQKEIDDLKRQLKK